jgi:predicted transcriptional regulator
MRKIDLTNFRVATSETARQINRRIALSFLRRHQPMSRADLARRSGLQRSTVSSIVDQLIEEQWVTERDSGRCREAGVRGASISTSSAPGSWPWSSVLS